MYISMNNKEAGIKDKRISEAVYPKDILADTEIKMCSLLAKGFWYECLFNMWHKDTYKIAGNVLQLSKLLGCEMQEVFDCVEELRCNNVSDVTESNGIITLVCRRLKRRNGVRTSNAKRQADYRERKNNESVTDKNCPSPVPTPISSPVPVSSSITIPDKNNIITREKDFIEQLKPFIGKYTKEMIDKFALYWTEPNKTKSKMRFELGKTWDTSRRLVTWSNNNFNGGTNETNRPSSRKSDREYKNTGEARII